MAFDTLMVMPVVGFATRKQLGIARFYSMETFRARWITMLEELYTNISRMACGSLNRLLGG